LSRTRLFNGGKNENGSRDYGSALIDAAIVAGFTFFSNLAGLGAMGLLSNLAHGLCAAGISGGTAFFSSLMISLQVKKPEAKK